MHRHAIWRILAATVIVAVAVVGSSAAQAQTGYEGDATLTSTDLTPACGQTVTLTGTGFVANTEITLTVGTTTIGTTTTDAAGAFSFAYTPSCAMVGNVVISATDGTNVLSLTLTVGATGTTTPPTLTPTGSSTTGTLTRVGIGFVVLGGFLALIVASRADRRGHAAHRA